MQENLEPNNEVSENTNKFKSDEIKDTNSEKFTNTNESNIKLLFIRRDESSLALIKLPLPNFFYLCYPNM